MKMNYEFNMIGLKDKIKKITSNMKENGLLHFFLMKIVALNTLRNIQYYLNTKSSHIMFHSPYHVYLMKPIINCFTNNAK